MSVAEFAGHRLSESDESYPAGSYGARTPPQDNAAEQCVLGAMMLSKDAIADVVESLRGTDFYRPVHESVFDAVIDLYGRGEPADAVTVAAELQKRGELARVGGAPYLHTLVASVPVAANAGYYAEIVREKAILRRLVDAGTKIVQIGYAGEGEVDDVVDQAQAEIYGVTDKRTSDDYAPLSEIMEATLDELDSISSRGGAMSGVPTGFADLDELTNGLHPGQMVIIAARPAIGKALAVDTPLPTPDGWTTMGQVQVGDHLIGADGRPVRVVAATEVMHEHECYEVCFSDGSPIVADAQHQWATSTRASRRATRERRPAGPAPAAEHAAVKTTEQIAKTLRCASADKRLNHAVRTCDPLELPDAQLDLSPYVLGVWLGDGHSAGAPFTSADPEIPMRVEGEGILVSSLGALDDRHIPARYLRSSERQRRELLAGLMDIDGTVTNAGGCQITLTSRRLIRDVYELIVSLGYRCQLTTKKMRGRSEFSSTAYTLNFTSPDDVFWLTRKAIRHKELRPTVYRTTHQRMITDVRRVPSVAVRCVQVDSADNLYLAGEAMVPTHNSTISLDFARSASIKHGLASVIFSLEMGRTEITMRLLSAEARIPLNSMRNGKMTDDDWSRLARRMGEVSSAPLFIDDSPNMTMMEIRAKARRLKQRHDLRLIIVDYLQLMQSGKKVESRQIEVSEFSRQLKLLAKELEVPVIAVSQLNRGPEQRTDKRPMLSDLRESGCLTADTTLLRADTGAPITFEALMRDGCDGISVWSLDEHRRMVAAPLTAVFASGVKETYRLTLASGRTVKASGNHQFLTYGGWGRLDSLAVGDRVAVPRRVPDPIGAGLGWSEHRLGLLAHLIGDGCVLPRQPLHYTSQDEENLAFVEAAADTEFGIRARRVTQGNWQHTYLPAPFRLTHGRRNPVHHWFRDLGIDGLRSHEKRLPDVLYMARDTEVRVFLRHLWATDGCIFLPSPTAAKSIARVYYSTSSRALADGVRHLLARIGLATRLYQVRYQRSPRPGYRVIVAGVRDMRRFCAEVGVHGARGAKAAAYLAATEDIMANTNVDTLPREVWELVKAERVRAGLTERQFQAAIGTRYCGSALYKPCLGRERLLRCADALNSDALRQLATDDVMWDRVVSIEALGPMPVYDATVKGTHNFIADGVVAHNSLEQDSDMVVLLHREDAYDRESTRPGEADLIVAKHRNGPTATLTVAFQGHYSRFVDMAPG